jgi:K+-transporting ATPase c subunit
VESPRVSSATALRTAARAGDEAAFYAASGTDPKLTVNGQTYFETVVNAVQANPEKVKKVVKKKVEQPVEGVAEDNDPCWKNYKQIGMKKKGGRQVPNCVPKK